MAAGCQGVNAKAHEGIVKYKKSVYSDNIAVHQWGGGVLPPRGRKIV
jgi:hypothetical protein